ncbi:hypothetical_protein [Leishmania major strain Friedlin]|nr:hypothetical_protein [Leishmania major strain Friedlin]
MRVGGSNATETPTGVNGVQSPERASCPCRHGLRRTSRLPRHMRAGDSSTPAVASTEMDEAGSDPPAPSPGSGVAMRAPRCRGAAAVRGRCGAELARRMARPSPAGADVACRCSKRLRARRGAQAERAGPARAVVCSWPASSFCSSGVRLADPLLPARPTPRPPPWSRTADVDGVDGGARSSRVGAAPVAQRVCEEEGRGGTGGARETHGPPRRHDGSR